MTSSHRDNITNKHFDWEKELGDASQETGAKSYNAFSFHEKHVKEYLSTLLSELDAQQVINAANLLEEADFGPEWQAQEIWKATKATAEWIELIYGDDTVVKLTDVNETLVKRDCMTKESFRSYWLYFVSPPQPLPQCPPSMLPELAKRVTEDYYRLRHSDIYGGRNSYGLSLNDLVQQVEKDTSELQNISRRLNQSKGAIA